MLGGNVVQRKECLLEMIGTTHEATPENSATQGIKVQKKIVKLIFFVSYFPVYSFLTHLYTTHANQGFRC